MQQEILPFKLQHHARFDNFFGKKNQKLLRFIKSFLANPIYHSFMLWGEQGCGKTHLLYAFAHSHYNYIYIPLKELTTLSGDVFTNINGIQLIAVDDVHLIAGNRVWEEKLFELFIDTQQNNAHLIFTSAVAPSRLKFDLPDLTSRLKSILSFEIFPLAEDERRLFFKLGIEERGMHINNEAIDYIFNHYPRSLTFLNEAIQKLEYYSLLHQKKITIALVKDAFS